MREVHLDQWVAPEIADANGFLQAGQVLEWMDVVGALAATRHCRRPVVTVSIEGMELYQPIRVGERVSMRARVAYTSRHSVGVSVTTDHGGNGAAPRPSLEAYMTFVPVDRKGRPVGVPPFSPETAVEHSRFREGELRREFRRQLEEGELTLQHEELEKVSQREWPLLIRQFMSRLPRYLLMPWEKVEVERTRHQSYLHKIEPIRVGTLNFQGTIHGGALMRWAEEAAALSARAHAGGVPMRCTGLHGLCFLRPVERDRFVHIRSVVVHTAGQTLTTLVSIQAEDPTSGQYCENLRGFFTYSPLDAWVRIAPVAAESHEERALFDEVEHRLALQRRIERVA
jgi:acyl-CoA hydrolase